MAEAESTPLPLLGLLNTCRADTPRPTPRLAQVCGSALFCLRRFASAAQAYGAAVRLAAPGTTAGLQDALADSLPYKQHMPGKRNRYICLVFAIHAPISNA